MSPEPVDQTIQIKIEDDTPGINVHPPDEPQEEDNSKVPEISNVAEKTISTEDLPEIHETSCFGNRTRHIILIIGTLCMTMLFSNILILNVTMMCMTGGATAKNSIADQVASLSFDETTKNSEMDTDIDSYSNPPEFDWSPGMKRLIAASGAIGAITCIPFAVFLLRRIGARKTFVVAGMLSATATALTPLAARGGVPTFILARFIQGAGLSSLFPVIGGVTAGWSTLKYSSLFKSVITSFLQFAPIFTLPVAGSFCESENGWPIVYYIHAAVTVIFFTMWAVFFKDSPKAHRWTTPVEIKKITAGKPPMPASPLPIPYLAILSSPTIWVIWLTALANFAGMQLFIIYISNFMFSSLGYSIKDACLLAALPPLAQFFAKIAAGILGDRQYSFLSGTSKVRVFNSFASIGASSFLLALAFVPPTERFWSIVLLMVSASFLGFNTSGLFRSPSLVARQHTHFIMTTIQVLLCVCLLGMPFVVDLLTLVKPAKDWSLVFGAVAFFLLITNVLFCVFAKGSPAPWTEIKSGEQSREQSPAKVHPTVNILSPLSITTEVSNSLSDKSAHSSHKVSMPWA